VSTKFADRSGCQAVCRSQAVYRSPNFPMYLFSGAVRTYSLFRLSAVRMI